MNERLPKREEVKEELTWRLEDIYPDEGLWEEELKEARALAARVKEYEGKLGNSAQDLYGALKLYDDCSLKLDRVGGYSFMRHDQDAGNSHYQELELKVQSASVRISEELAFVEPEILAIPDDVIARFYEEEHAFQRIWHALQRGPQIPVCDGQGRKGDPALQRPLCAAADVS